MKQYLSSKRKAKNTGKIAIEIGCILRNSSLILNQTALLEGDVLEETCGI